MLLRLKLLLISSYTQDQVVMLSRAHRPKHCSGVTLKMPEQKSLPEDAGPGSELALDGRAPARQLDCEALDRDH